MYKRFWGKSVKARSYRLRVSKARGGAHAKTGQASIIQVSAVAEGEPFTRYKESRNQEQVGQSVQLYRGSRVNRLDAVVQSWEGIVASANGRREAAAVLQGRLRETGFLDELAPGLDESQS